LRKPISRKIAGCLEGGGVEREEILQLLPRDPLLASTLRAADVARPADDPSSGREFGAEDIRPEPVKRPRLLHYEICYPIAVKWLAAAVRLRLVVVAAQKTLDLDTDRRLDRFPVSPVDLEVGTDALDEVAGDRCDLRVRIPASSSSATIPAPKPSAAEASATRRFWSRSSSALVSKRRT
jgi:hypothetical protein